MTSTACHMIAIDTSALIAILQHEPERATYFDVIADALPRLISAVSVLEAGLVMHSKLGPSGITDVFDFLEFIEVEVVPFDASQARLALEAFAKYGKGVHSKARLNFGDCASYALAKSRNAALLFKVSDFTATDITAAI